MFYLYFPHRSGITIAPEIVIITLISGIYGHIALMFRLVLIYWWKRLYFVNCIIIRDSWLFVEANIELEVLWCPYILRNISFPRTRMVDVIPSFFIEYRILLFLLVIRFHRPVCFYIYGFCDIFLCGLVKDTRVPVRWCSLVALRLSCWTSLVILHLCLYLALKVIVIKSRSFLWLIIICLLCRNDFRQAYFFDLVLIIQALSSSLEGIINCQKSMVFDRWLDLLQIYDFRTLNVFLQSFLAFPIFSFLFLKPSCRRPDLPAFNRFIHFFIVSEIVFRGFPIDISIYGDNGALATHAVVYALKWFHWSSRAAQVPYFQYPLLRFRGLKSCEILVGARTPVVSVYVVYRLMIFEIGLWFIFIDESWWLWLYWLILILHLLRFATHIKVDIQTFLCGGRILFRVPRYHILHQFLIFL